MNRLQVMYLAVFSTLLASPFFGWAYPNLWYWMGTSTPTPEMRVLGLLCLSCFVMGLVFGTGVVVFTVIRDIEEKTVKAVEAAEEADRVARARAASRAYRKERDL